MRGVSRLGRSARSAAACASLLALMTPATMIANPSSHKGAVAHIATNHHDSTVPANYDIRWELAEARAGKLAVDPARAAAAERLAAKVSGLTIHADEASGLPKMITTLVPGERLSGSLAAKASGDPAAAARSFLSANATLYGLSAEDLATARLLYVTAPKAGQHGATIVRFEQKLGDRPVFGAELTVVLSRDLSVAGTSGMLYPDAATGVASKRAALSMADALAAASGDLARRAFVPGDFEVTATDDAGYTRFEYAPDRVTSSSRVFGYNLRGLEVVFPVAAGEMIPAYYVEVLLEGEPAGSGPAFGYVISAEDGSVLFRNNQQCADAYSYRVFADGTGNFRPYLSPEGINGFPHPTGLPDGYQGTASVENNVTIDNLLGGTDSWLPAGATVTTGNNVDAYLDVAGGDGFTAGDIRGEATAPGQFLNSFNHTISVQDPIVRQSKAVHMFFYNNWLHDIWYQKGFNEVSRNAQTDNYGRGGAGNDSLNAEGEDRTGTNNANMFTPADGSRPRMQMYRFPAAEPDRDSSVDFGIVAHEWMHYMSNRLIGNASGLNNQQGGSMGEGWGDWCGIITSVREGMDLDGSYTTGAWSTYLLWTNYTNNYYFGIRRFPYSTRTDRNPQTFADIGSGQSYPAEVPRNTNVGSTPSEVHNAGEVWCQMMWDASVALMKTYGVDAGRDRIMQYATDGMKNTPSSPTFGQARDGIITAANAADPNDVPILWQAFSKRGIGEGAVSPASGSGTHAGIVESYVAPAALPDDTVTVYQAGTSFLRNVLAGGQAEGALVYGAPSFLPIYGNWNGGSGVGADSASTVGAYDPATASFFLRYSNTVGAADVNFIFGAPGAKPIAGDWDGDGVDTVGVYEPINGTFFLRNSNASGPADVTVVFGPLASGMLPIAGDWNNDGTDTIGLYDPVSSTFFLKNSNTPGAADITVVFGSPSGLQPLAGDWNGDGIDTIGLYNPASGAIFLRNSFDPGDADRAYTYGPTGSLLACGGNFDGQ
jgi:extracellular elastinolytic metalloproteinase